MIRALENHGFRYIETTVINSYDIKSRGKQLEGEGKIRLAYEHELPQLVSMVDDAFTTHRFYADQKFSKEKADQMYREWVESSINSGDWETIVMEAEGKVRGFFVYRIEDMSEYFQLKFGKWRLAALGLQDRGSGYGTQLFSGAMNFIQDRVDIIDSGLTVRNTRSFNLHNKLGFKIQNFSVTMHKWFE